MRTSDRHAMLLDHVRFHGVLVELSKIWAGIPMRGDTRSGPHEWAYIDGRDEALRAYAVQLSHGFPTERQGARRR
jgi:hypothetical protein